MTPELLLDKLADIARNAYYGVNLRAWDKLSTGEKATWRRTVDSVLAANAAVAASGPFPGAEPRPDGGLKPGDVVSVRGVVKIAHEHPMAGVHVLLDEGCVSALVTPRTVTFIERPAPPEPTWAPGDLAEDNDGKRYAYPGGDGVRPWLRTTAPAMWLKRDEIPGPLHKLTVTREDAP